MSTKNTALIVLTYERISTFESITKKLELQTNKDYDLFIYNSGPHFKSIEIISQKIFKETSYNLLHTDINEGCWRRYELARELAQNGYKRVLFLDDDIIIPSNYIDLALKQYEQNTYKSWWAWDLMGGNNYDTDRVRVLDKDIPANYCGAGVSIIDSSIFLDNNFFNIPIEETKWMDDIWLSFYSKNVLGWNISYLDIPKISFSDSASDSNALYKKIDQDGIIGINKKDYLIFLKNKYDWKPIG
jgi:hypothetical protein